ncbi:MAG TPA: C40 family peptidase [Streptosporangiaceae bacterium]|nr:C40 family peptidase [Streptosporangiaceae bacterium]
MHTPLSVRKVAKSRVRAGLLIACSLATAAAVVGIGGSAAAAPMPTVAQVQQRLAKLEAKASKLGQQYDQVLQELSLANQRLSLLNRETARFRGTFDSMRQQIGRLAAVAYEQGGVDSPIGLLTSASPRQVLSQASILNELAIADGAQVRQYVNASRQLLAAQQAAARTRAGILTIKRSLGKRLAVLNSLKAQQESLLAKLSPAQQQGTGPGDNGGGGGHKYTGPTSTQAEKAVAFAYDQLGCPYVFGGTGPCSDGFDCSGLMMASWGDAGVSIPRVSYDQMSELPAVALHTSSGAFTEQYLQPGDILGFAGNSHVGMYVGGGYLIDAPVPGESVEKIALSGWYLQNLDGAVRP